MNISNDLSLVVKVENVVAYSATINYDIFTSHYLALAECYSRLDSELISSSIAPIITKFELLKCTGSIGLLDEIRRLTTLYVDGKSILLSNAIDSNAVSPVIVDKIESLIVFFILNAYLRDTETRAAYNNMMTSFFSTTTTSLTQSAFAAS